MLTQLKYYTTFPSQFLHIEYMDVRESKLKNQASAISHGFAGKYNLKSIITFIRKI